MKIRLSFGKRYVSFKHFTLFVCVFFLRNGTLTEELECQLTSSISCKKEEESDSDLDID